MIRVAASLSERSAMLGSSFLLGLGFAHVNSFVGTKTRARHRRAFSRSFDVTTLQGDQITFSLEIDCQENS